jgi:hypothetical protein
MSDDVLDSDGEPGWHEVPDDFPTLDTEEEREQWAEILLEQDMDEEGVKAVVVRDEHGNMVVRFRYQDGREELFDVAIRRSLEVIEEPKGESN